MRKKYFQKRLKNLEYLIFSINTLKWIEIKNYDGKGPSQNDFYNILQRKQKIHSCLNKPMQDGDILS